jgi:hypothetical protein
VTSYRTITSTNLNGDTLPQGEAITFNGSRQKTLGFYDGDLGSTRPTEGRVPAFLGLAEKTGGRYIEKPPTVAEGLRQTGLDFIVKHEPLRTRYTETGIAVGDDDSLEEVETEAGQLDLPDWRVTVAYPKDGGQPFAIAPTSKSYAIVQNDEALAMGDEISEGRLVALGAYGKPVGARVYAAYELGDGFEIAGDPYRSYLTIGTTHDRSGGTWGLMAPIRIGCTNQTTATFGRANPRFVVRHTGNPKANVEEARRILGLTHNYVEATKTSLEGLLSIKMTRKDFVAYTRELFKFDAETTKPRALAMGRTREEKLLEILGSETCAFGEGTAYQGFQAATEYLDWAMPVRGGDDKATARAARVLDGGAIDDAKTRAYEMAAALA